MSNQEQSTPEPDNQLQVIEEKPRTSKIKVSLTVLILLVSAIYIFKSVTKDETSPGYLLGQMTSSVQLNACERAMDDDQKDDYWVVNNFEEVVAGELQTDYWPAITYSSKVHEDAYYTDSLGKSDFQNNIAAADIEKACRKLADKNIDFSKALDKLIKQKADEVAAIAREKAEAKAKIQPLLEKWNKKAIDAGSGDIREYLEAESAAEYEIKSGASYSFTGATANISGVSCYATTRSNWVGGKPGGWWSCIIQTLGGGFNSYSIEFSGSSWGGKPDNGQMAGADLSWRIPDELMDWINSSS